jgi:hypothetical protein
MESKSTKNVRNRQPSGQPVRDIANLSTEEKAALLEKTLAELEQKNQELRIEAALDRVRTRAMAMQRSDELSALVAILFDELTRLDLILSRCIIWIIDPTTFAARLWMANSEDKTNADSYYVKPLDHPYFKSILKAWQQRTQKWVYDLQGAEKKAIDALLLNETELSSLPEAVKTGIRTAKHTIVSGSFSNFGFIEASGPVPYSEEQLGILQRFARAFDQTYTRFLDLQKAEAQAREAQIHLALERVRARTMAMRRSEELSHVATVLFQQVNPWVCHNGLVDFVSGT